MLDVNEKHRVYCNDDSDVNNCGEIRVDKQIVVPFVHVHEIFYVEHQWPVDGDIRDHIRR